MNALPVAAGLLLLAACTPVEAPAPAPQDPPADAAACGAAQLQHLVGQPRATLSARSFPASTRFIGPDTMVTMDFSPERLNIRYDEQGIIVEVFCG